MSRSDQAGTFKQTETPAVTFRGMTMPNYCATLYRYYNGAGVLLYVGLSQEALGRLEGHRRCKDWYYDIKSIRLEHHEIRYEALCAERQAIETENPLYNGAPVPKRYRPSHMKKVALTNS